MGKGTDIPELVAAVIGALAAEGFGNIPVQAAGGIMDGRGIAAGQGVRSLTRAESASEIVVTLMAKACAVLAGLGIVRASALVWA